MSWLLDVDDVLGNASEPDLGADRDVVAPRTSVDSGMLIRDAGGDAAARFVCG